jgi:hypothetical protein
MRLLSPSLSRSLSLSRARSLSLDMHVYQHVCTRDTHTTPQFCARPRQHHRGRLRARRPLLRGATSASLRPSSRAPRVVVEEWCQSALLHLRNTRRPSPRKHRRASPTPAATSLALFPRCDAEHAQVHMPECCRQRNSPRTRHAWVSMCASHRRPSLVPPRPAACQLGQSPATPTLFQSISSLVHSRTLWDHVTRENRSTNRKPMAAKTARSFAIHGTLLHIGAKNSQRPVK